MLTLKNSDLRGLSLACCALSLALGVSGAALAQSRSDIEESHRATEEMLSLDVERYVLPNGLVVVQAPDTSTSSVLVWMTFRAGALYEPPERSGLAHLVEHLMATGPTPETDYQGLLARRRARSFNAFTGVDKMIFTTVVPAEELPLALWVAADRLGTLPGLLDAALVEKERGVIEQERAERLVDVPYGLVEEHILARLFPVPHPLHGGVLGTPAELGRVTLIEVRDFIATRLVPANATLTIVGNFDSALAHRLVEQGLGRLASGRRAQPPPVFPPSAGLVDKTEERISRQPRISLAWRFRDVAPDHSLALELGAQMLTLLVDGAFGMRIEADYAEHAGGESVFRMDLELPYDEPVAVVEDDANGFLRMLTLREMPVDFILTAHLAMDRAALFALDQLEGRARILVKLESLFERPESVGAFLLRHWEIERELVRDTARVFLRQPRVIVHARPTRPRPARVTRQDEE
ncbi:MAG: insulinase family protein [Deltaproteobacteria bacterium]|nr:insulinase family protein [Deltaproteobacteria bacterium]